MKYKLLVLDVDGTLLNSNKEITARTQAALLKVQQMGIHIVLASGRPTNGVMPLAKALELVGAVCGRETQQQIRGSILCD